MSKPILCRAARRIAIARSRRFALAPTLHRNGNFTNYDLLQRITLTSRKCAAIEKVCTELLERAKSKDLRVKGPVRLPTKNLKVTTRKTPCGEGSKTWDTYEMRLHKRLIEYVFFSFPMLLFHTPRSSGTNKSTV